MRQVGIDISDYRPKSVAEFLAEPFGYVVMACDHARRMCPTFPGPGVRIHRSLEDPAQTCGSPAERLAVFRRVRDQLAERLREFLAQPAGCASDRSDNSQPHHGTFE